MKMVCGKCRKNFAGSVLKPLLGASVGAVVGLVITPTMPPFDPWPPNYPWFPVVIINNRSAACIAGAAYGWLATKNRMLCPACRKKQQGVPA